METGRKTINHFVISVVLLSAVAAYEGYSPTAYVPIKGDVVTIGHGTTAYPDGTKIKVGDTISRRQADDYLKGDLDKFKQGMMTCIKAPLYEQEFNAYLSLTYNIGTTAFCNSSIPIKLNRGQYNEACKTILQFNKMRDTSKPKLYNAKTGKYVYQYKVIKGLDTRRKAEYKECIGGSTNA